MFFLSSQVTSKFRTDRRAGARIGFPHKMVRIILIKISRLFNFYIKFFGFGFVFGFLICSLVLGDLKRKTAKSYEFDKLKFSCQNLKPLKISAIKLSVKLNTFP